ncbi:hypothetical protein UY3_01995 [Chelonia mydas]|uniref:Uncharacterized protein n=1 Tax=Chelonia mydas TaxID=8469 RepID=M7BUK8_CHEMY|nr:hypothetical protein UY3_01995 [Chelonia mydas]
MDQAAESAAFKDTHRDVFAKKLTFTYNGLKFVLFNGDKVVSKVHLQDKANPVYYSSNLSTQLVLVADSFLQAVTIVSDIGGSNSARLIYTNTPSEFKGTILHKRGEQGPDQNRICKCLNRTYRKPPSLSNTTEMQLIPEEIDSSYQFCFWGGSGPLVTGAVALKPARGSRALWIPGYRSSGEVQFLCGNADFLQKPLIPMTQLVWKYFCRI